MALPDYDEYLKQHAAARQKSTASAGTDLLNQGRALDLELKKIELERARSGGADADPVGAGLLKDVRDAAASGGYTATGEAGKKSREDLISALATKYVSKVDPAQVSAAVYGNFRNDREGSFDTMAYLTNQASQAQKPLSTEAQKFVGNAETGLRAVETIRNELANKKGVRLGAALPFNPGAQTYSTAIGNATDVIARLRSGAAITEQEEKSFRKLLPKLTDSPQTVEYKLAELENQFRRVAQIDPANRGSAPAAATSQAEEYKKLYGIEY